VRKAWPGQRKRGWVGPQSAAERWRQRGGKGRPLPTAVGRRQAGCPWPGDSAPWEASPHSPTALGRSSGSPSRAPGLWTWATCGRVLGRYQVVVTQLPDLAAPIPLPSRLLAALARHCFLTFQSGSRTIHCTDTSGLKASIAPKADIEQVQNPKKSFTLR
jgi:hypothetical protein